MSVFQYKAKAFGGGESSSSSDDDVSDGEFERELERQRRAEAEAKEKKGKGKKPKSPAKTKAPKKKQREVVEIDDDVEAFAPAINVDDDEPTKPSPPKKKKARGKKQESSDDDDDADEDTKRRLRMLRESRAAREAMRQAERKVENLAESDDEPVVAQPTRRRRVQVEAPPKPQAPKYGGALLKIKIRTEGDAKPLDYEIREDEPFAELFERYACDRGVNAYDCKFVFDGEVVGAGSKPRALDMESEDMIDCKAPPRGRKRPRPGPRRCGNQSSGAPRHRRDVVCVDKLTHCLISTQARAPCSRRRRSPRRRLRPRRSAPRRRRHHKRRRPR